MKRIIALVILAGLLVIGLVACSDDPQGPVQPEGLLGTWRWIETCTPTNDSCLTPESEGYSRLIAFTSDSMYHNYRNDTLIFSAQFSVIRSEISPGDTVDLLVLEDYGGYPEIEFYTGDTLCLSYDMPLATFGFVRLGPI